MIRTHLAFRFEDFFAARASPQLRLRVAPDGLDLRLGLVGPFAFGWELSGATPATDFVLNVAELTNRIK
jgi:hypothetical protein